MLTLLRERLSFSAGVQGRYTYPFVLGAPVRILAVVLLALALLHYVQTWVQYAAHNLILNDTYVLYDVLRSLNFGWVAGPRFINSTIWIQILFGAHLALALAIPLFALLYNILPDVWVHERGLAVRWFNSWMMVPWHRVASVKVMSVSWSNRLILLVETSGPQLTRLHRIYGLLFGIKLAQHQSFIVTTDIQNFDTFIKDMTQRVVHARNLLQSGSGSGQTITAADVVYDNYFAPVLKMVLDPLGTYNEILANNPDGLASALPENATARDAQLYGKTTILKLAAAHAIVGALLIPLCVYKFNPLILVLLALLPVLEWLVIPPFLQIVCSSYGLHDTEKRTQLLLPAMLMVRPVILFGALLVATAQIGRMAPFFILLFGGFWITVLTGLLFKSIHEQADLQTSTTAAIAPLMINIVILIMAALFSV